MNGLDFTCTMYIIITACTKLVCTNYRMPRSIAIGAAIVRRHFDALYCYIYLYWYTYTVTHGQLALYCASLCCPVFISSSEQRTKATTRWCSCVSEHIKITPKNSRPIIRLYSIRHKWIHITMCPNLLL